MPGNPRPPEVDLDPMVDLRRALRRENEQLRKKVANLSEQLELETARRLELEASLESSGPDPASPLSVEADGSDDDELGRAFEEFLSVPDPHLDQVRDFLLG